MGRTRGMGASKGCRTCRRRKVKCDELHPFCKRCEKSKIGCEGYVRENRFVDEVARTVKHAAKARTTRPEPGGISSSSITSPETITSPCNSLSEIQFTVFPGWLEETSAHDQTRRVGRQLQLRIDDAFHLSFLQANILSGLPASVSWLYLQATDISSASAQPSIRALAAVYFGRRHFSQAIVHEGSQLYGQALRSLNKDLLSSETGRAWSVPVLRSAIALEFYELIAFNSSSGWLKHAGGVGRLIQLRGPKRHQDLEERDLLAGNRVTIALECLVKRKRCFLEKEEWKTVPWALDPSSKRPLDYLQDILCDIPGLMEDAERLQRRELPLREHTAEHESLSKNITSHLENLCVWRTNWDQRNPEVCFEVSSVENYSPLSGSGKQKETLFFTVLYYADLERANEITSYNAILLLLFRVGFQVMGPSFGHSNSASTVSWSFTRNPLHPPRTTFNPFLVAIEICRSVEYHLRYGHSAGAFFLLFPLRLAWQTFEHGTREKIWCESVMARIADGSGWEIGRGLTGHSAENLARIEVVDCS